jgi:hypothetical protein
MMLKADGFDEAIIGVGRHFDSPNRLIYDYDKCVLILSKRDGMDYEEAVEFMEFNVLGAYAGKETPIFKIDYAEGEEL